MVVREAYRGALGIRNVDETHRKRLHTTDPSASVTNITHRGVGRRGIFMHRLNSRSVAGSGSIGLGMVIGAGMLLGIAPAIADAAPAVDYAEHSRVGVSKGHASPASVWQPTVFGPYSERWRCESERVKAHLTGWLPVSGCTSVAEEWSFKAVPRSIARGFEVSSES